MFLIRIEIAYQYVIALPLRFLAFSTNILNALRVSIDSELTNSIFNV
jgi:hypothetical protein